MAKKLMEIASEIVQAQASKTSMTADDIASALQQVLSTLYELQRAESGEIDLSEIQKPTPTKVLKPVDSVQSDKVICLECGAGFKQITQNHLASHGMSARECRTKYGFTMRASLAAKTLSKARRKAAKKRGLPEKLQNYLEARRQPKDEVVEPALTEKVIARKPKHARLGKKKA